MCRELEASSLQQAVPLIAPLTPHQKVTCVHKANIMKLGDGLFLNTCKRVAEQEYGHTGIKFDSMIVDNTSMQLVSKPQQFDVMVMPNVSLKSLSIDANG